jgi:hypothetical protein
MRSLISLFSSEIVKLKRTLALWMVLIAPLFVIVLQCALWLNQSDGIGTDADLWLMFSTNILSMWGIFMFPLFCALVVALVYQYEHTTSGWQKLYTLPVSRWHVLAAKQSAALFLLLASGITLFAGTIAAGFVVDAMHPNIDMPSYIPVAEMARRWTLVFIASLMVFAVQNWVSLRWTSLSVPIGTGIGGTFVAIFATSWKYGHFYPWLMPIHVLHRTDGKEWPGLWIGSLGGILLLIVMNVVESRRDQVR